MLSIFFYLVLLFFVIALVMLFFYQRKQKKSLTKRQEPILNDAPDMSNETSKQQLKNLAESAYDPKLVVLQIQSFADKPYMGYELLQTLLSVGLQFDDKSIFHHYEKGKDNKVLFSVAAATPEGTFAIDDMGAFKCQGLVLFMQLHPKQKLMQRFDLMLDIARQLTEELGGDIYDDLYQPINAAVIRRLREKICTVETSNLYAADLLDNLD